MSRRKKWVVTATIFFALLGAAAVLRFADLSPRPIWMPRCLFHDATGLYCPGCGNTRATTALLHGDLAGAVAQNAAFVVALPFLLWGASRAWLRWVYPERWKPLPIRWRWSWSLVLIGLVVIFTLLRNLPVEPLRRLAPKSPENRASADRVAPFPGSRPPATP